MELGKQIKKYRSELSLSQEALADKVYVSRQTISNWENDKNYPDINSLVLLSEVFHVSLDTLIKGDVEVMKEQIETEDRKEFDKQGKIFSVLMIAMIVTPVPLAFFLKFAGIAIWGILAVITMVFAIKVEKLKKQFDIQSYREIVAFMDGTRLDEISKAREEGKRSYQKIFLAMGAGIIALLVGIIFILVLR